MSDDSYHDDPVEEIPKKSLRSKFLSTGVVIVGSIFFLQSTLAGNISLNSNRGIEFGQSVSQAVACSGNTELTLTPRSTFVNGSPGAHYLQSVTVSNIPTSCYGDDFTINAYGDSSSTPLALFNSTSTNAVIYNNNGAFSRGTGSSGMTVSSGAGSFTATFTTPVAQSSSVLKLTIQSGLHTPYYLVGDRGPGGGFIYYVNESGFNCGPTYTSTGSPSGGKCKYLEVAPSGWNTGSDPGKAWGGFNGLISSISNEFTAYNNILGVGLGYKHSLAIIAQQGATTTYAAGAARAYVGGGKGDWYLPTLAELNLLCQWSRGVASSVTSVCSGGSINSSIYGAGSAGFAEQYYWSSSAADTAYGWRQTFSGGQSSQDFADRVGSYLVRPIRAF